MPIGLTFQHHVTMQQLQDGDNQVDWWLVGGWLLVGCGVGGHLPRDVPRYKLGRPTAAMVPHPRQQCIQQSADMLRNRSALLKLDKTTLITINLTNMCTTRQ
jgi:hypothetical protein